MSALRPESDNVNAEISFVSTLARISSSSSSSLEYRMRISSTKTTIYRYRRVTTTKAICIRNVAQTRNKHLLIDMHGTTTRTFGSHVNDTGYAVSATASVLDAVTVHIRFQMERRRDYGTARLGSIGNFAVRQP